MLSNLGRRRHRAQETDASACLTACVMVCLSTTRGLARSQLVFPCRAWQPRTATAHPTRHSHVVRACNGRQTVRQSIQRARARLPSAMVPADPRDNSGGRPAGRGTWMEGRNGGPGNTTRQNRLIYKNTSIMAARKRSYCYT